MTKFTPKQVTERILGVKTLSLTRDDIISVRDQKGGLINHVFRINTKKGLFFLKQFLEKPKTDIFKDLEIGSEDRALYSCRAERMFEKILNHKNHIVPHVYHYDKVENYLILEGFENVTAFFKKIEKGIFLKQPLLNLAKNIALVHQQTFSNANNDFDIYDEECLDWKLKHQYDEMTKLLNKRNATKLKNFTKNYKHKRFALIHGDLCSINILVYPESKSDVHIIDFEDVHIGSPAFDLGYLLSEYLVASVNFTEKQADIYLQIIDFLNVYFSIFDKQDRNQVEAEVTIHVASMMLYRTFGMSSNVFTKYIKDNGVRDRIKEWANEMIENSNQPISRFIS